MRMGVGAIMDLKLNKFCHGNPVESAKNNSGCFTRLQGYGGSTGAQVMTLVVLWFFETHTANAAKVLESHRNIGVTMHQAFPFYRLPCHCVVSRNGL